MNSSSTASNAKIVYAKIPQDTAVAAPQATEVAQAAEAAPAAQPAVEQALAQVPTQASGVQSAVTPILETPLIPPPSEGLNPHLAEPLLSTPDSTQHLSGAEKWAQHVSDFMQIAYEYFLEAIKFVKILATQQHALEIFGVILLTLLVLFFVRKIYLRFKPVRLFNNSAGVVEVSRGALNDLAESVCYGMGAMNKPKIQIYFRRRRLCLNVELALEAGQSLAELSYKLQSALSIAFREHLGVEKLGNINVKVISFKGLVHKPIYKQISSKDVIPPSVSMRVAQDSAVHIDDYQVDDSHK